MQRITAHQGPRPSGPGFRVDVAAWASVVDESRALTPEEVDADTVAAAAPVPGRRTTSAAATLSEVLVAYDDEARSFVFDTIDLPRPLRLAQNRTTVETTGDGGTVVRSDIRIVLHPALAPLAPLLRRRMTSTFGRVLRDLRTHVEEGVVA